MKIVLIGGSGHIGSYLIPKLVHAGHKVLNISRGQSKPYKEDNLWREVENIVLNRDNEPNGEFERKIAAINADIVIDLINFSLADTKNMVEALKNTNLSHFLYCSSIWAHGKSTTLPILEDQPRFPLDEYGIDKAKSEAFLHDLYRKEGFPETVIMPGQISGAGWVIINPVGNLDVSVFKKIQRGEKIAIPNFGMETLHHVHADDVAQVFFQAISHRNSALGESFHAVGSQSITLLGYAQALYRWFGHEENIDFLPWNEWCDYTKDKEHIEKTYLHIVRSGHFSIEKGKRLINYCPRHTLLETVFESVTFLSKNNWLEK
ncbi:NAD-dependent epimerase/dehydratase family protein [Mucilaginibacter sabulilitoris]|uniref:NAD-dependent epimerase/dehydratase family protein n=1 Tax=Mucilaginibacter sabulilitoris TaxID=1173583 RepID=A0ABZ0TJ85_9SPHI|nr:NAD-dependent epimerase/dehydratase family protein [Mucilaginibacter sabulilitoris]WPU92482.1 NAD-dependent epimerase/dehydratase family protein [Mucilaginibacter sabulilitoris]